jgi:hypothetical protein
MARKDARNVNPSLSDDAGDKLLAALNWTYGRQRGNATYERAPMYFDACSEWYDGLSDDDQELCRTLADVVSSAHMDAAVGMAASLPPAPRNRYRKSPMPWTREDLRRAQEHIEQALQYISMQERRITELQREGRDTGNAEELLASLRQTLLLLIRHKTLIERDLK